MNKSKYDGGFDADNRCPVVGGFTLEEIARLHSDEEAQPKTFRQAFMQAVLSGKTSDYWARRGTASFEVDERSEVYQMELAEAGK